MTLTRPFPRAFTCAGIFCGYAVPYVWMDEPGRAWPIHRTLLAAVFAAAFVGMIAARFGWPLRWWQFAVSVLFVQVVVACALEFGVQHVRPNVLQPTAASSSHSATSGGPVAGPGS